MRQSSEFDIGSKITFLSGDEDRLLAMGELPAKKPFSDEIKSFFLSLSDGLIRSRQARQYPDAVAMGMWLRNLCKEDEKADGGKDLIRLGRGTVFHIAPSNVPLNFAYSLAAGLITGNANIVRVPSKDFPQVGIFTEVLNSALDEFESIKPRVCLIRYGRDKSVNDFLSSLCDVRVIWGGDRTVEEIRKSPLPPRGTEITFADRFSFAVIDSDAYMAIENKRMTALDFYNDTFLFDQNACTSPRLVVWTGGKKDEAKELFWSELHSLVKKKDTFQPITAVNKLVSACMAAVNIKNIEVVPHDDNLIIRLKVNEVSEELIDLSDNSGFFFEYDCDDIMSLRPLCTDNRVQTVGIIGDRKMLDELILSGVKGIDRVVPIGKTMEFSLIWDGYDLSERLTRTVYR